MFSDKIIIITGASSGIGKEISLNLSKENAQLIFISRNLSSLKILSNGIHNNKNLLYSLNVSKTKEVQKFYQFVKSKYSRIDCIINCAGIFGPIGKLEQVSPDNFLIPIQTNLIGTYNMCYYGLPFLKKSEHAKIINFSGGGTTSSFPNYSGYACSKIALVKLTENMAIEYPNLDINIIAPGFIKTPLAKQTIKSKEKAGTFYTKTIEMLNNGGVSVKYVVSLCKFLISNKSDGISGKFISAPWDNWEKQSFIDKLKTDKDYCTLRRIDNKFFQALKKIK